MARHGNTRRRLSKKRRSTRGRKQRGGGNVLGILIAEIPINNAMTRDVVFGETVRNLHTQVGPVIYLVKVVQQTMKLPSVEKADTVGQMGFVLRGSNSPISPVSNLTKRASAA